MLMRGPAKDSPGPRRCLYDVLSPPRMSPLLDGTDNLFFKLMSDFRLFSASPPKPAASDSLAAPNVAAPLVPQPSSTLTPPPTPPQQDGHMAKVGTTSADLRREQKHAKNPDQRDAHVG